MIEATEYMPAFNPPDVIDWRILNLIELGFETKTAEKVADSQIDCHEIYKLVKRGCSPKLALEIVS